MSQRPIHKSPLFLSSISGLLCSIAFIAALGAYILIVDPSYSQTRDNVMISTLMIGLLSLVATGASVVGRRGGWLAVMIAAVAAHAVGTSLVLLVVWYDRSIGWEQEEVFMRTAISLLFVSTAAVHSAVLWRLPGRSVVLTILRITTCGCAWFLTLFVVVAAIDEDIIDDVFDQLNLNDYIMLSVMGTVLLCGVIGTVLVPIMSISVTRRAHKADWLNRSIQLELDCPRCGHRQSMRQGASRCANCRAMIYIELEEPRCACGYLLFDLRGDTCPECGLHVENAPSSQSETTQPTPPPVIESEPGDAPGIT